MKLPSPYPVLDNRPIDQWKVTELKDELKRRKLTVKGLKEDLIKRLDEAIRNENESGMENADNGFDGTPQPVVEIEDTGTAPAISETTGDMMDHGNNVNEVDGGMDQARVYDTAVSLGEGKVQEGEVTGGTDFARDEEMVLHAASVETSNTVNESVHNNRNEADDGMDQAHGYDTAVSLGEGKVQEGEVTGGTDFARDEEMVFHATSVETSITVNESVGNNRNEVDGGMDDACVYDTAVSLGEGKGQEGEVTGGTDFARDEERVVHATSVETSITVSESVVSEIAVNVQESQNNDSQNETGDLKFQVVNEEIKPPHEDVELNSSDPNNQVSEVSTVLGFQVKSDSISSDCISINEKNELKDNIIADNVKLELDVKPEMVQPSSSNFLPDDGKLHPMDVEEPHENKAPIEERDDNKTANAELSKKNDSADVVSSEKLNLDRSSGEDSMEDDALESKQIDSKYNSDEVGDRSEKNEIPVVEEEAPVDIMQDDIPVEKKGIHDENKNASAATIVKRKLNDKVVVGNNETSKRQRRWFSENLKVPDPQSNIASATTPKDSFPSTPLKRNFSRFDSTASDDASKERVVPPSPKPPTKSLRIDRFLRPFTLKAVQELLGKTGTVSSFWMDHIKTHCYVTYSSVEEAIETRNAVYNLQWPPNGGRLLVAEFVDPQEVKMRAEAPPQSPATPVSTGPTTPPAPPTLQPQPSPRQLVQRQQLPPPPALPPPPPLSNPPPARERLPLPPPPPLPEKVDPPIVTLDDLFRKTKATPRIYYLPLSDDQVAAKLKEGAGKSTKQ